MKTKTTLTSGDWLIALSMAYAAVSLAMNVFCMKSLSWGTSVVFSDGGQVVSWIVFLISNIIVEVWGERESVKVITFAAFTTFALLVIGRLLVFVPTLPEYAGQTEAFAMIFSNGPRTIVSSIVAFWVGGFVNVRIISLMKRGKESDDKKAFFSRASFSTLIGQFVDNAIFMTLAFAPLGISVYEMMWKDILSSVIIGTIFELVVEALMVPVITIPLTRHIMGIKEREEKK
ncbi:MAG: queuosine precursor transporter [Candidatus Ornithospirochaeta sp.]